MRILFQNRFDMLKTGAGDRIHFFSLLNELRKKGITVDYSLSINPDLTNYDLVHLFNISRGDTFFQSRNAKLQNKPAVLTPLYNPLTQFKHPSSMQKIKSFMKKEKTFRYIINFLKYPLSKEKRVTKNLEYDTSFFPETVQKLFSQIDMLFPGSNAELDSLSSIYNINSKSKTVYLGVDNAFFNADGKFFIEKYGIKDFILSVGTIMPRKNHISLIEALKETEIPTVFIGRLSKDTQYNKTFLNSLTNNMKHIEHIPFKDLISAYAAARAHALVSYSETTGLVNLEAGATGTAIICSDIPVHREYFKNYAYYCNPYSSESIRKAVVKAYKDGAIPGTRSFLKENYNWSKCADDTISGYLEVLD